MKRLTVLPPAIAVVLSVATPLIAPQEASAQPRRPNIIFILADDLGYGDLGCYGQKTIRTPNIDRLATEGLRFTACYAGSTVCAPSRCVLMTGLHTGHARIRGNAPRAPLEPGDITVAAVLKRAGYATGIIGKWGLAEPATTGVPNRQGFDYWFGYLNQTHAHNYYPDTLWKNEQEITLAANRGGHKAQYSHDLFTDESLAFVERYRDRPFFLYLAFTLPHANNELGRDTRNGMEVPTDAPYTDEPWPQPQKNHAAMITRLDASVGKLISHVKQLGLDQDTIVFFSSDNGPHKEGGADPQFFHSAGPLRGHKRDLFEGGIRVPMIVRWPGKIAANTVSDHVWAFWDFLPTAAEMAGTPPPTAIDGVSRLPTLLGRQQPGHAFLYWEFHERGSAQAVRYRNWKAVRLGPDAPLELYDLAADPGEQRNIAGRHADVVLRIEELLAKARTESKAWPLHIREPASKAPQAAQRP